VAFRGGGSEAEKFARVLDIFLDSAESLAEAPDQLSAAVQFGLERAFDQLVREACREVGLPAETFSARLEADADQQARVQARLGELFSAPALEKARELSARKEAERHLHVLRYVLSGEEPADWVWKAMDREERSRLRAFREAGGDEDEPLLARVRRTLHKLAGDDSSFGHCEACGGRISPERLGLIPYAERCTPCQDRLERPATAPAAGRVQVWMFVEGGKPVPPEDAAR
jgi:RNA polymerase-binding transcription factor DksA